MRLRSQTSTKYRPKEKGFTKMMQIILLSPCFIKRDRQGSNSQPMARQSEFCLICNLLQYINIRCKPLTSLTVWIGSHSEQYWVMTSHKRRPRVDRENSMIFNIFSRDLYFDQAQLNITWLIHKPFSEFP